MKHETKEPETETENKQNDPICPWARGLATLFIYLFFSLYLSIYIYIFIYVFNYLSILDKADDARVDSAAVGKESAIPWFWMRAPASPTSVPLLGPTAISFSPPPFVLGPLCRIACCQPHLCLHQSRDPQVPQLRPELRLGARLGAGIKFLSTSKRVSC